MKRLVLLLMMLGCGNAEIVAPASLAIVDAFPGQGSLVAPGDVPIVLVFSEAIDVATLEDSASFGETTTTGNLVRELSIELDDHDAESFTATLKTEPLDPDASFTLQIDADTLRATSGARLTTNATRRFRTASP